MAPTNLLLIRGLGHSGSTILDLALGAHSRVTGLGEAVRILQPPRPGEEHKGPAQLRGDLAHSRRCTCGRVAIACPVWGDLLAWLRANDDRPLGEKLALLCKAAQRSAAQPQQWLVDSFQSDLTVPTLAWQFGEIRTLFLVRDLRSWVHSRSVRRKRPGAAWPALARWVRVNRGVDRALRRSGRPVFVLGYEEFALAPEAALRRVCTWLGLEFEPAMLHPGTSSSSHLLAGNRMRFDPERSATIRYDGSWMAHGARGIGIAAQLPPLRGLNRRWVYGNGLL